MMSSAAHFLPTSQAVFNPVGGSSDDVCPPPFDQATCLANLQKARDIPIADVLASPPQQITAPLALEAADSSFTGIDFVPDAFVIGPVQPGAALYSLEGDFGFSAPNATAPAPEVGHEVKLINFNQVAGSPLALRFPELCPQQHRRPSIRDQHQRVQPPDQHQVRPGRLRLCRRLRRSAGSRLRLAFCRSRQWPARPDPGNGCDLENLPNVAMWLVHPVTRGGFGRTLFQRAGDAFDAP
jgi:hypothetical protein